MTPSIIPQREVPVHDSSDIKAKVVQGHVEVEIASKPALADDYMYDFKYNHPLPTIESLGCDIGTDIDPATEASVIVDQLEMIFQRGDGNALAELFLEYGVWRDKLSFSWDYRTFNFRDNIRRAGTDLLPATKAHITGYLSPCPAVIRPYADLSYLQFTVSLETVLTTGSAVVNAVLTTAGWRLWTMHTSIESLLQHPELPPGDGHMTGPISWELQRHQDVDRVKAEVVIIGGGQNGLALAARLKALGVSALIIERAASIGEIWIKRYEYLSLHFPHWADHFPYFPFPKHWPTYTPAQKLGYFMQWYASSMELAVWTNSNVSSATNDNGNWTLVINKNGEERILYPKHVVMATSLCGVPTTPIVPGMDKWKGLIRHSTTHDSARAFKGKRVLVVGTSSSGMDTAYDCARHNVDVTLLQRSPTYVMSLVHSVPRMIGGYEPKDGITPDIEEQDRLSFAMPVGPAEELARRTAKTLEELDKEMLDGLKSRGFKTWRGQRNTGNGTLGQTRNGGFYFEAGACEQIINGKIKIAQGSVQEFTEDRVILSDGTAEHFDLVIFATGFSNTLDSVRITLGQDIADACGPIWGVDEEGEFRSCYKESGVENLWIFAGYLPYTRYHSKRLALRLKALLEGISPSPYKV